MLAPEIVVLGDEPQETPRLGYQPALDGLRALAVGAVLLYHGGVSWASGGYLGVDVFFVLSGFLITTLLVEEWRASGTVRIGAFYGRRARRLFPALVPVLVAVALYGVFLAQDSQLRGLRGDVLATVAYATNWHLIAQHHGYFDAFTGLSPLTHTWSLAVEEQWYLVWPVVALVLLGRGRRRHRLGIAAVVTAGLCAGSAIWMAVLASPTTDPSRVYYGTDTRAQELLLGSLLAFVCAIAGSVAVPGRWRWLLDIAGGVALAAVLWLFVEVDYGSRWLYEGGMLAVCCLVAVVVLAAVQPGGVLRRGLGVGPLRFAGLLSYALYLWHFPIYVTLSADRTGLAGTPLLLVRLATSVLAAVASYHLIEHRVRRRQISTRRLLVVGPILAVGAVVAVVVTSAGAPLAPSDIAAHAEVHNVSRDRDIYVYDPSQNPMPPTTPYETTARVVVTGDSMARTLSNGFKQRTGVPPVVLWDQSIVGCQLFAGERVNGSVRTDGGPQCGPWRADRDRWLRAFHPDVIAVHSGAWETYDKIIDGKRLRFGTPAFDRWFSAQLDGLVADLGRDGARTVFLTAPCNRRLEDLTGTARVENDPKRLAHLNALYRKAAARHPATASLIDLAGWVCPGERFDTVRSGVHLRSADGVHFTPEGAAVVRRWLFPQLAALRRR